MDKGEGYCDKMMAVAFAAGSAVLISQVPCTTLQFILECRCQNDVHADLEARSTQRLELLRRLPPLRRFSKVLIMFLLCLRVLPRLALAGRFIACCLCTSVL
jgi:hypothetical protein